MSAVEPAPRSVLIFRALQLGDMLCSVPALRAFRRAWPDAEITLAGLPWASEFAERFAELVDGFVAIPAHPELPETASSPGTWRAFRDFAASRRFDLAIQLHGSGRITNPLVASLGARQTAGFFEAGRRRPSETGHLLYPTSGHEIHRLNALADFLGLPHAGDHLEFPLSNADQCAAEAALSGTPREVLIVHPGSQLPSRRWGPARFAAVADRLATEGMEVVITGTAAERALGLEVAARMREPARVLAGNTTLGGLGAIVSRARLILANDTGISHLAAALRTPSVIVACGSDPGR